MVQGKREYLWILELPRPLLNKLSVQWIIQFVYSCKGFSKRFSPISKLSSPLQGSVWWGVVCGGGYGRGGGSVGLYGLLVWVDVSGRISLILAAWITMCASTSNSANVTGYLCFSNVNRCQNHSVFKFAQLGSHATFDHFYVILTWYWN